jgi:hypothetical protein
MVIPPARTGKDRIKRPAVTLRHHKISGKVAILFPGVLLEDIVIIKFILLNKELIPAICNLKTTISTL